MLCATTENTDQADGIDRTRDHEITTRPTPATRARRSRLRRSVAVGVLGLALAGLASCENDPLLNPVPTPSPIEIIDPGTTRYISEVFTDTVSTPNITYTSAIDRTGNPVDLQADVHAPAGDTETSRPLMIFVHGGGWTGGARNDAVVTDQAREFARYGFVTATIDYRLNPLVSSPYDQSDPDTANATADASADIVAAIAHFQANADSYGIDALRIVVVGRGTGATAAMYANFQNSLAYGVQGIVSISGNVPSSVVGSHGTVTAMIHGETDPVVSLASQSDACATANANGRVCNLSTLPFGHDLDASDAAGVAAKTHEALYTFSS